MYEKLLEVEDAIIDFEKVMVMINLSACNILNDHTVKDCEQELLLLQELFMEKFNKLKTAFYDCYEKQTA